MSTTHVILFFAPILKGKNTHFRFFDTKKYFKNLDEQKTPHVKSFIRSRDISILRFLL